MGSSDRCSDCACGAVCMELFCDHRQLCLWKRNCQGTVRDGVLTVTYENRQVAQNISDDMDVIIGGIRSPIDTVGVDEDGNIFSVSHTDFPDGNYEAKASYKQTQVISMLFN